MVDITIIVDDVYNADRELHLSTSFHKIFSRVDAEEIGIAIGEVLTEHGRFIRYNGFEERTTEPIDQSDRTPILIRANSTYGSCECCGGYRDIHLSIGYEGTAPLFTLFEDGHLGGGSGQLQKIAADLWELFNALNIPVQLISKVRPDKCL